MTSLLLARQLRCNARIGGMPRLGAAAVIPCLALLTSCTVGPNFHSSVAPPVDRYTEGPTPSATVASDTAGGAQQHLDTG